MNILASLTGIHVLPKLYDFLQQNTKDILNNVGNQTIPVTYMD